MLLLLARGQYPGNLASCIQCLSSWSRLREGKRVAMTHSRNEDQPGTDLTHSMKGEETDEQFQLGRGA